MGTITLARLGLAFAEASDIFTSFPANFIGNEVDDTTVLVRCLLLGDANFDRKVTITDFARLAANFNATGSWSRGDFNYDNLVSIGDFALLATNFNNQLTADLPRGSTVPEPVLTAFLLAAWPLIRRR